MSTSRHIFLIVRVLLAVLMCLPARAAVAAPAVAVVPMAVPAPTLPIAIALEAPGAVLGLDSSDRAAGDALTKALRKAFAKRGIAGGQEMSLREMRLTMGCENDAPKCLAEGGKAMQVEQIVYGYLDKKDGAYVLRLALLDVGSGTVSTSTTSKKLSPAQLSSAQIEDTATAAVNELLGVAIDTEEVPPADTGVLVSPPEPETTEPPPPEPREKKYEWGLRRPVARWKKVGFGVTFGLALASLTAAITLSVLTLKGTDETKDAAKASQNDVYTAKYIKEHDDANHTLQMAVDDGSIRLGDPIRSNDVDPTGAYCALADDVIQGGDTPTKKDDRIRNETVTAKCIKYRRIAAAQYGAYAAAGVLGAAALTFLVLMFVRKKNPGAADAMRRRQFNIGGMPSRGGGSFSFGLRF